MNKLFVIMGVSGSGKSAVSSALAHKMRCLVLEADDFHSAENIEKMSKGIPLSDQDREPWIDTICYVAKHTSDNSDVILACSALTKMVQSRLLEKLGERITWIWLDGSFELIKSRLDARQDHFMPSSLLASQFDALTVPSRAIRINIDQSISEIVEAIEVAIEG